MTESLDIKDTLIGPLPTDWKLVRLGDVTSETCERNQSLQFGRDDVLTVDNQKGLIPSDRKLGEDFSRYKIVRENDFAYNPMRLNVGSIGHLGSPSPGVVSPDYIVFRCNERQADTRYMDEYRRSAAWSRQINQSGQGSIRIRYYYRHIGEFFVPLPPLAEQHAIACVLRTIRQAKESTEKVIRAGRRLKQSLMRHLFTYGPVPFDQADKVALKEAEFGPVPENWPTERLDDLTTLQSGGTPPRNCPDYFVGSIPWVKTLDLAEGWVRTTEETISEEGLQSIRGKMRPLNTVMVAMYGGAGTVGKAGILGISAATNQAVCCILPSPQFDSFYLLSFMVMIRPQWMRYAIGTRKDPNIGKGIVERASIPLPPPATQREIGAICATIDSKLDTETARYKALTILFNTLLHDLMTGKVRVV